jgi:hypothetical protein
MAQTSKTIRKAYDTKTYRQYGWRVRRNSELCEKLEDFKLTQGASLNWLVNSLLAKHFEVPMPDAHNDM